jgi:hypothetical protein
MKWCKYDLAYYYETLVSAVKYNYCTKLKKYVNIMCREMFALVQAFSIQDDCV